jgi:glycosyltransferase involved in cell wall biosynthesis
MNFDMSFLKMNKDLTILIPVRDEEENVNIISKEIIDKILCKNYEILFVNDFSQDRTEDVILDIMKNEVSIRYINNQKKV